MSPTAAPPVDRPAMIRAALRALVAERGFHGASMSAIAQAAGVAAGTAYVHYDSKDDVIVAAYLEAKQAMTEAALAELDPQLPAPERFRLVWRAIHRHFEHHPETARFMTQVECSPYFAHAAESSLDDERHPLVEAFADVEAGFADLPPLVLFELGLGPAIRQAATGDALSGEQLDTLAASCWRAIHHG